MQSRSGISVHVGKLTGQFPFRDPGYLIIQIMVSGVSWRLSFFFFLKQGCEVACAFLFKHKRKHFSRIVMLLLPDQTSFNGQLYRKCEAEVKLLSNFCCLIRMRWQGFQREATQRETNCNEETERFILCESNLGMWLMPTSTCAEACCFCHVCT